MRASYSGYGKGAAVNAIKIIGNPALSYFVNEPYLIFYADLCFFALYVNLFLDSSPFSVPQTVIERGNKLRWPHE